jgi:carboxyl-terminal processing protease
MGNKKLQVWLPLIFSMIMIGGMFFGFKLRENTASGTGFFKADKKTSLQEILDLIKQRYVDPVSLDSLQSNAIDEMMKHLDPHSIYIPATQLAEVNEDLEGNFTGIGVEFNVFLDTVHVVHVIAGGPSDKAGLQVGDRIIKVNGETIAGKSLSSDEIKKRIRAKAALTSGSLCLEKMKRRKSPSRGDESQFLQLMQRICSIAIPATSSLISFPNRPMKSLCNRSNHSRKIT